MGRPRKSAKVIELHGNRAKLSKEELERREKQEAELAPTIASSSKAPADLSELERECWELHATELNHLGLLTVLDLAAFRLMVCQPYEMAMAGRAAMFEQPLTKAGLPDRRSKPKLTVVHVDAAHGVLRRHPGFLVWKAGVEMYRQGCGHFGLTPSSRVNLRPGAPVGDHATEDDDDDSFFGT